MPVIVISYRRADSKDATRRIHQHLVDRYGKKSIFMDIDSLQPSVDYRINIRQHLERALVMLAVVGKEWSGPRPNERARIFDNDDPVRVEVETALANRRPVMPLLINGARMPTEAELPHSLGEFPYLHALEIDSGENFASDLGRLSQAIGRLNARFWALYASIYLALPALLLILSDYLILFKLDLDPLVLRAATALIAALLGLGMCFRIGFRTVPALLTGLGVAVMAVIGMLVINTALQARTGSFRVWDIVPSNMREWQEVLEYVVTITAVTLGSNALSWAFRDRRGRMQTPRSG